MTEAKMSSRVKALAGVVIFLFASLVTRLWFLQVLAAEENQDRAESNRVRVVPLPAPRGNILDREGRVLIDNRSSIEIVVNRQHVDDPDELLFRLSEVLDIPVEDLVDRYNDPTYLPYQPVPLAKGVPERVAAYLAEHNREFPGVEYRSVGVRRNENGSLAAHLIGYLGEVNEQELNSPEFAGYRPGDEVGRGGVEQEYEGFLRGEPGLVNYQVDAEGRIGAVLGRQEPEPGNDLFLSIDLGLQEAVSSSLADGIKAASGVITADGRTLNAKAGAVVALDPDSGQVLAMSSYPTFDPRVFQDGVTRREWKELTRPAFNSPLANRATQGQYPAASALKPFVAAAAVNARIASPNGYFPCPPEFQVPGDTSETVFHNWTTEDMGHLSLAESLSQSCDTVFYQFGLDFYRLRDEKGDWMQRLLRRWGFGRATGIDLPGEAVGRIPDSAWKQRVHDLAPKLYPQPLWLPGDNINMSIGQGDLLVTPLQMAAAFGALANGGTLYAPEVGLRVQAPDGTVLETITPEARREIKVKKNALPTILEGLRGAVTTGTAADPFAGFPHSSIPIAGKTGTAEAIVDGRDVNHSWFAAVAPMDDPEIVVVAIVEEGGHGSEVAAPIVRRVLEQYFGLTPSAIRIGTATD